MVPEYTLAPPSPSRRERRVSRPQLRRRADHLGPHIRLVRLRDRRTSLRHHQTDPKLQPSLDPNARLVRDAGGNKATTHAARETEVHLRIAQYGYQRSARLIARLLKRIAR